VFKEIAALYTQSRPNVQIIFENKAPDLQTAVLAAISTGEKFDLFIWAHDWIGLMVEAGVLKPVDNDVADVLPKFAVQIPQYKGRIYGLPFTAETVALICNKKMVPEPPKTFADLAKIMQQYNKPPQSYGIAYVVNPTSSRRGSTARAATTLTTRLRSKASRTPGRSPALSSSRKTSCHT